MIKLFGITDSVFTTNGDLVIKAVKAKVRNEDNGVYYLDLETGLEYIDDLTEGRIIAADTPEGVQAFRVGNVIRNNQKISTRCYHVFYDSKNYLVPETVITEANANTALARLNAEAVGGAGSPFLTLSDVEGVNSYTCTRKSLYEAFKAVVEQWGGHLVRNNFSVQLRKDISVDNGITVRYGKNIQTITSSEDWSEVVTKILPVGKDGILLNALDSSASIYIESETQYTLPYVKTVTFTQTHINSSDYLAPELYKQALIADLRYQAEQYLNQHCVPAVNYTVKINIDGVGGLGEVIEVIDERLGLNLQTNVIAYEYDCVLERYTEIELGNFQKTITGLVSQIQAAVTSTMNTELANAQSAFSARLEALTQEMWASFGESYVIYDGDKILVVDSLPKESATNVMLINANGIAFSNTGINGTFNSVWGIDGAFVAQSAEVLNLTADMIQGNTLTLGGTYFPTPGEIRIYNAAGDLIGIIGQCGVKIFGGTGTAETGRPYVLMNEAEGFAGYDKDGNKIYWAGVDSFHMKKALAEEELTICDTMRFIKIDLSTSTGNEGIGLVAAE